jgi:hypothetical protein
MNAVHFRWSRASLRLYIALAALISALGVPMLLAGDAGARLLVGVWIAAFAWLILALARRMSDTGPVVSADALGLHDRRIAKEGFGWDEISSIEAYEAENLTWVGVELKEPGASLAKTGWLVRLSAPLHRLFRFPRVSISMALLDGSSEDLIAAIRAHRPDLVRKI